MEEKDFSLKYTFSNKIFFIYSCYYRNEISKIKINQYLEDIKLLKEEKLGKKIHLVYCLILKKNYNKEPITLEIDSKGVIYSTKIKFNDLLSEIFLFSIDFKNKDMKNDLTKFTLSFNEQFKMFSEIKNLKNLKIGFSDDFFKNLCLSSFKFMSSFLNPLNLDFLFNVLIYSYSIQKKNYKENLIKQFFNSFHIKLIDKTYKDIKYKKENKLNINFGNEYLSYFSNVEEILGELAKIGGEENIEKIHLILAYYYLKYYPKNFINLVSLKNNYTKNLFENLTNNRKLFSNFTSEIINLDLFDEAGNINQIENLLKYLPNMEEFFKEFLNEVLFSKVALFSGNEGKNIDVLALINPNKDDDIEKIYNYFLIIMQYCKRDGIMIFKLRNDFFKTYADYYVKLDLQNIKYVKEMYGKYSSMIKPEDRKKMLEQLNGLYFETGLKVINNNKSLKNEEFINFLQESGKENINISPELFSEKIDLKIASEEFKNEFLNNDFKKFDLKATLRNNFYQLFTKIFEKFETQGDFLILKNWKISPNIDEGVLEICIKRIKTVLINQKKAKKITIYTDLIDFYCNLFSISSKKFDNKLIYILKELEENFTSSKLIEIYFRILHKGNKVYPISDLFNDHLKDYIEKNSGGGALSLWYKLVIIDNSDRLVYLYEHLKPEHAVKKEDFVVFPGIIEERISLFSYLSSAKYFTYDYITELDYYKNSINAKKDIIKLIYEQGMKIYNNYNQFFRLFKMFVPPEQYKEEIYYLEYTSFYDQLSSYKVKYESLNSIKNYWNKFFPKSKNNEVSQLNEIINSLAKTQIDEFESKINNYNNYLTYLNEAQNGEKLQNSLFFNELYEACKNKYNNVNEKEIFDKTNEEFKKLKNLIINLNFNEIGEDFKSIIIKIAQKDKKGFIDELYFIQNYFGCNKNENEDNQNKFNIEKILIEIEKILPKKPVVPDEPIPIKRKKTVEIPVLKEFKEKVRNLIHFSINCKDNDAFLQEYIKFFKEIFEEKNIINLKNNYFNEEIINNLKRIYFYGFEYSTQNYIGDKRQIYIINDFFGLMEIYEKIYNNDNDNFCSYIKNLFPLISNRMDCEGFDKDFNDIQNSLFPEIIEKKKSKEKDFSKCFIDILIQEIKKTKIKSDCDKIVKYIIDSKFLIDDCIPLINEIYEDKFFVDFKNNENKDIVFKDKFLSILDKNCEKNKLLREKLLFYFESNINKIINEKFNKKEKDFKDEKIQELIKKSISILEKPTSEGFKNISLLFAIAFLKIILIKYIKFVDEEEYKAEEFFKDITKNNDLLSYYVLKIYLDKEGNYYDLIYGYKSFEISSKVQDIIKSDNKMEKFYGFDYLFLPMHSKDLDKYKDIVSDIKNNLNNKLKDDTGILQDLNSKMDILYCVIANLFLSKFKKEFFNQNDYDILLNWLNNKLENKEFKILNQYSIKLLQMFINMKDKKIITYEKNKDLIYILFALRIVLNSLSPDNKVDPFFYNLIINTKNIISKYSHIFSYFFVDNKIEEKKSIQNTESFMLIRFILLSHLFFSYLLKNINKEDISAIIKIKLEDELDIFKILIREFESIKNIIRFKGVKSKYCIIYMNIIFDLIKSIQLSNISDESNIKYFLKLNPNYYLDRIKNYFEQNERKNDDKKKDENEFSKIIFEDFNYYKNLNKDSYLLYFTTPNFCEIDDFIYQYNLSNLKLPMIEFVMNKQMDNIINIVNCLPEINSFINKNYNENVLKITREESENNNINRDFGRFNKNIIKIKNYLKIEIEELTNNSKISEIINIKDNKIYKMYENLDNIIKEYNDFLLSLKIYSENPSDIQTLYIQNISKKDCFNLKLNERENTNNLAFDRLLELIIIYSKRNRYNDDGLNVYSGEIIFYDFQSIEKRLEKELILGKKLLKNYQSLFIFSNEIFANENNNLISDFITKFPQEKKESEKIQKFEDLLDNYEENRDEMISIYHNLQYIILFLMKYYDNNNDMNDKKEKEEKILLKNLPKILGGYEIHKIFLNSDDSSVDNIIEIYEIIEDKIFDFFKDIFEEDNIIKDESVNNYKNNMKQIKNHFDNDELLISEESFKNVIKKYNLRYCLGDYEKKEEILNNLNIDKLFLKNDIWESNVFNDKKFKEENEKLKSLNGEKNYLIKYFLLNLIKDEQFEDDQE